MKPKKIGAKKQGKTDKICIDTGAIDEMESFSSKNAIKSMFFNKDPIELTIFILKVVLWCMLMTIFVMLEFGAVFFILSLFYFMLKNFRETENAPGEMSAYSVFNPNCERIDGTLTAEQFENEIRRGPLSLR